MESSNANCNTQQNQQASAQSIFQSIDIEDQSLPKATLTQIIKEMCPHDIKMSCQSQDLIISLTMHFLTYLSDQSNKICNQQGKKTITPEHVSDALEMMKMSKYAQEIFEFEGDNMTQKQKKQQIQSVVSSTITKKGKKKGNNNMHGMTEEELQAEQQRLIEDAQNYNYDSSNNNQEEHQFNQEMTDAREQINLNGISRQSEENNNGLTELKMINSDSMKIIGGNIVQNEVFNSYNLKPQQIVNTPIFAQGTSSMTYNSSIASLQPLSKLQSSKQVDDMNFEESDSDSSDN